MNVILFILIFVYVVYTQWKIAKLKELLNICEEFAEYVTKSTRELAEELRKEIENGEMEEDSKQ